MPVERREIPPTGVLQEWVVKLGLRQQGVLLTVVRGCDMVPKEDVSKDLTRAICGVLLNTHCANPEESSSYIQHVGSDEMTRRMNNFADSFDHYPTHFVLHVVHVAEVIGYYHPAAHWSVVFRAFYKTMCHRMHMKPETQEELVYRLDGDEDTFADA